MAEEIVEKKVRKTTTKKAAAKAKAQEFLGTGRRKCSVARVRITAGTGSIIVNDVELDKYFDAGDYMLGKIETAILYLKLLILMLFCKK